MKVGAPGQTETREVSAVRMEKKPEKAGKKRKLEIDSDSNDENQVSGKRGH